MAYEELKAEQLVVLVLQGDIVEVDLRPSSDTPTHHLALYRSFVRNPEFTLVDLVLLGKHFLRKHGRTLIMVKRKRRRHTNEQVYNWCRLWNGVRPCGYC
ncbi:hypothetical protein JOE49_002827 [Paenibacillus sp. PvR133]|nr:hypothetical protein [Paenibacillus sp. PvR133]